MESSYQTRSATSTALLLSVMGILFCAACSTKPKEASYPGELFYSEDDESRGVQWSCSFESPIIVAGNILDVKYDMTQWNSGLQQFPVARVHIDVLVKSVLKGNVPLPRCIIQGYVFVTGGVEPRKRNPPVPDFKPGQARLFFLRQVDGQLRLARDLYDYTIPLYGDISLHEKYSALDAKSKAMALLLLPPAGENAGNWARNLNILLAQAAQIAGPGAVGAFLESENIVEKAPPTVRTIVKEELAAFLLYHPRASNNTAISTGECPDFGQLNGL
jgi:hypothetical protein